MHISCILQGARHEIDGSTSYGTDMAISACRSPEGISAYWRSAADRDVALDDVQPTNGREEVWRGANGICLRKLKGIRAVFYTSTVTTTKAVLQAEL